YKNINIFKESYKAEKTIDQSKIIKESQEILSILQSILKDKDNKNELKSLSIKASLFKDKKISPFSFYSYLDELARRHIKDLDSYTNLINFVSYLKKINSLDSNKLFNEIEELTYDIKDLISDNPNQKLLTKSIRNIRFLESFFNLKVSNEDFERYLKDKDSFKESWFKSTIEVFDSASIANSSGRSNNILRASEASREESLIDKNLPDLENFYELAHTRDIAMFNNAISEIDKRKSRTSAMIAGGFHTRGITDLLKEKGYSYVVISPYSKTQIDEENYRDLLAGKRKPLKELIKGLNSSLRLMLMWVNDEFREDFQKYLQKTTDAGIITKDKITLSDPRPRFICVMAACMVQIFLAKNKPIKELASAFNPAFRNILKGNITIRQAEDKSYHINYEDQYLAVSEDNGQAIREATKGEFEIENPIVTISPTSEEAATAAGPARVNQAISAVELTDLDRTQLARVLQELILASRDGNYSGSSGVLGIVSYNEKLIERCRQVAHNDEVRAQLNRINFYTIQAQVRSLQSKAYDLRVNGYLERAIGKYKEALDYTSRHDYADFKGIIDELEQAIAGAEKLQQPLRENMDALPFVHFFYSEADGYKILNRVSSSELEVMILQPTLQDSPIEASHPIVLVLQPYEDRSYFVGGMAVASFADGVISEPQTVTLIKDKSYIQRGITLLVLKGEIKEWRSSMSMQRSAVNMYKRMQADERLSIIHNNGQYVVRKRNLVTSSPITAAQIATEAIAKAANDTSAGAMGSIDVVSPTDEDRHPEITAKLKARREEFEGIAKDAPIEDIYGIQARVIKVPLYNEIAGYNFKAQDGTHIIALNSITSKAIQEEAKFHEAREIYWIGKGFIPREAHVIAWAEQVIKFSKDGKLTPYQMIQLAKMGKADLENIIKEGRIFHRAVLQEAIAEGADITMDDIEKYERNFKEYAEKMLDEIKDIRAATSEDAGTKYNKRKEPMEDAVGVYYNPHPGDVNKMALGAFMMIEADGMGGEGFFGSGKIAAEIIKERAGEIYFNEARGVDIEARLRDTMERLNNEIRDAELDGGGTAVDLVVFVEEGGKQKAYIAHIGNTETWLARNGVTYILTNSHAFAMAVFEMGAIDLLQAVKHPRRSELGRALHGKPGDVQKMNVQVVSIELQDGDKLLTFSDGVGDVFREYSVVNPEKNFYHYNMVKKLKDGKEGESGEVQIDPSKAKPGGLLVEAVLQGSEQKIADFIAGKAREFAAGINKDKIDNISVCAATAPVVLTKTKMQRVELGGEQKEGELTKPFIGDLWIKAGSNWYRIWNEKDDGPIYLQRYDSGKNILKGEDRFFGINFVFTIGRDRARNPNYPVDDGELSRLHFSIEVFKQDNKLFFTVKDLESTNGTTIEYIEEVAESSAESLLATAAFHLTEHKEPLEDEHLLKKHELEKDEGAMLVDNMKTAAAVLAYYGADVDGRHEKVTIDVDGVKVNVRVANNIKEAGITVEDVAKMINGQVKVLKQKGYSEEEIRKALSGLLIVAADKLPKAALGGDCVGNKLVLLSKGLSKIEDKTARIIMADATLYHEISKHELTGLGNDAHIEKNDADDVEYVIRAAKEKGFANLQDFINAIRPTLSGSELFKMLLMAELEETISSAIAVLRRYRSFITDVSIGSSIDKLKESMDGARTLVEEEEDVSEKIRKAERRLEEAKTLVNRILDEADKSNFIQKIAKQGLLDLLTKARELVKGRFGANSEQFIFYAKTINELAETLSSFLNGGRIIESLDEIGNNIWALVNEIETAPQKGQVSGDVFIRDYNIYYILNFRASFGEREDFIAVLNENGTIASMSKKGSQVTKSLKDPGNQIEITIEKQQDGSYKITNIKRRIEQTKIIGKQLELLNALVEDYNKIEPEINGIIMSNFDKLSSEIQEAGEYRVLIENSGRITIVSKTTPWFAFSFEVEEGVLQISENVNIREGRQMSPKQLVLFRLSAMAFNKSQEQKVAVVIADIQNQRGLDKGQVNVLTDFLNGDVGIDEASERLVGTVVRMVRGDIVTLDTEGARVLLTVALVSTVYNLSRIERVAVGAYLSMINLGGSSVWNFANTIMYNGGRSRSSADSVRILQEAAYFLKMGLLPDGLIKPSRSAEEALKYLQLQSGDTLLSLGSGISVDEVKFALEVPGLSIIALDKNADLMTQAKANAQKAGVTAQFDFKEKDFIQGLDLADNSVKAIYARLSLHGLSRQELERVFTEMYRVLTPGGKIFIVVKSDKGFSGRYRGASYDKATGLWTYVNELGERLSRQSFENDANLKSYAQDIGLEQINVMAHKEIVHLDSARTALDDQSTELLTLTASKPTLSAVQAAAQTAANPFGEIIRHLNKRFGLDIEINGLPSFEGELIRYDAYEEIMRKGEKADALYIINKGEVEIPIAKDGIGITFVRGKGNIVGEMGILGLQQKRSAVVYAGAAGATLLRIPYEKILPFMKNNPQLFFILNLYIMENRIYQADLKKYALKIAERENKDIGDMRIRVIEKGPEDNFEKALFLFNHVGNILDEATIDEIRIRDIAAQLPITLEELSERLPRYAIQEHGYSGKNTWGVALDINPKVIEEVWDIVIKYPHFLDVISGLDTKSGISEDEQLFIFYKLCVIYLTAKAPFAKEAQTPKARLRAYILQYLAEDALARTITYAAQDGALTVPSLSPDKAHLYGISSAYSELIEYDGVINSFYRAILRGELYYEMAVDFNFWTPGAYLKEEMTKPMKEAIRILAERSGMRLSIHGPIFYAMPGVEYNSEIIVKAYKNTVDLAKEIGASSIVVHVTFEEEIDDLVKIALYGAQQGIEISLENSRALNGGPYQNARRFLDVAKEVAQRVSEKSGNTDFLSQTWDFSHFALCPEVLAARKNSEKAATTALKEIIGEILNWTFDKNPDSPRIRLRKIHLSQHEGKTDLHNLGVAEEDGIGKVPNVKAMEMLIDRLTAEVVAKLEIILETAKVISEEDLNWLDINVNIPIRNKAKDILAQSAVKASAAEPATPVSAQEEASRLRQTDTSL
ncbi:MAG TPA: hypothetical protein DCY56_08520, partial [Candidatus Omnitrophica bacterium]|nr:hypothetical protein [Candidatus Omnitrophota bacterium]